MNLGQMQRHAAALQPRLSDEQLAYLPPSVQKYLERSAELGLGDPKAAFGPFRQMYDGAIALANQTAITGTSEAPMFPVAQYTGFAANQLRAGQVWRLTAFGILTTAGASPGNITLTPRFGTSSSGTSLGASAATALSTSASNVAWRLEYDMIVRAVGLAGANSSVVGNGHFHTTVAAIAASVGNDVPFGSTASVNVDLSVASGLYIGVTMGSASDSMTTLGVTLESLN